jgi:hypothetical protein
LLLLLTACAQSGSGERGNDDSTAAPVDDGISEQTPNASCGDANCGAGETCQSCEADCGPCGPGCPDGFCDAGEDQTCPQDCGAQGAVCGDMYCDQGESQTCPQDCGQEALCGDMVCDAGEEQSCPQDCGQGAVCGDMYCDAGEQQSCPQDCGQGVVCGDMYCDAGEQQSCPQDCGMQGGTCSHSPCQLGPALDPNCDPCASLICGLDPYCCSTDWDSICVDNAAFFCGCV